MVLNNAGEVLVVRERRHGSDKLGPWKLPGGVSDAGEHFGETAAREVLEETGVRSSFVALVGLRNQHGLAFGKSDLYAVCRMQAESLEIRKCDTEIGECVWMPMEDYVAFTAGVNPLNHHLARLVYRDLLQAQQGDSSHAHLRPADWCELEMESVVYKGRTFKLYTHPLITTT